MRENRVLLLVSAILVGACGGSKARSRGPRSPEEAERLSRYERPECETSGREEVVRDVNGDGRNDIRQLMKGSVETCREIDGNFDGRMDFYRFFTDAGQLERLDEDLDFDGKVDQVTFFENGVVSQRQLDTNFDDLMDTRERYTAGVLASAERDSDMDGDADYWEHYQGGRLTRVQWDENSDGTPDRTDDDPEDGTQASAGSLPAPQAPPPAEGEGEGGGATP